MFNYLLKLGSPAWLIGIPQPPTWLLIALPCSACLIMSYKKTQSPLRSILCLLGILFLTGGYTWFTYHPQSIVKIPCNSSHVYLVTIDNNTLLIDPGALGSITNPTSWVNFTLIPTMTKHTGRVLIDQIIILKPGQRTFATLALCLNSTAQKIYMPFWTGTMNPGQKYSYAQLMKAIADSKATLIRFGGEYTITIGSTSLNIRALDNKINHNGLSYPAYSLTGSWEHNELNVASVFKPHDKRQRQLINKERTSKT
jgi:hypothetical protein